VLTAFAARTLLVLHTALAVAAVGASTHLVLWLVKLRRGQAGRFGAVKRFAWIVLVLQVLAFAAGNLMYPTYKVAVRAAYLESPDLVNEQQAKEHALEHVMVREGQPAPEPEAEVPRRAARAARWFDVKEHWIALGILGSCALVLILALWDPARDGRAPMPVVIALAAIVCATLWLGAVIGVVVASWRAV
jgi:hypothetical protein